MSESPRVVNETSTSSYVESSSISSAHEADLEGQATPILISWQNHDTRHPFNWPWRTKLRGLLLALFFNACTAINATGYNTAQRKGAESLETTPLIWLTGTTCYIVPVAIAPLLLAPLSETYGRKPLYAIAFSIFTLMYLPQALAPNIAAVLTSRVVQGIAGSVGNTMAAGSVADMYCKEQRAVPMGVFVLTVFCSQAFGSVASSWTVTTVGWRWMFWWQGAFSLLSVLLVIFLMPETRAEVILTHIAKQMTCDSDKGKHFITEENAEPMLQKVANNITRPLLFFVTEPIICFLALWIGFLWGTVFISLNGVSDTFSVYGWSVSQSETVLLTIAVGGVLGFITNLHQAKLYADANQRANGPPAPEARLYWSMVAALLTVAGLFWYAWSGQQHIHPCMPIIGLVLYSWGTYIIYLATLNYIADAYETYASSGIACQALLRNIFGGTFVLFSHQMYRQLSPPIASTILACIACALGTAPFILYFYGHRLRAKSRVCRELRCNEIAEVKSKQQSANEKR